MFFILLSMLFIIVACTSDDTFKSKIVLPEDIPDFVQESNFKTIDWERKAIKFGDRGIVGNENKSGVIGSDMPSLNGQKWMWHLWGVENVDLTVVGYHRETGTAHQVLFEGLPSRPVGYWTRNVMEANNGADAHMPSGVKIPKSGEWAMLLYTDGELFDVLVYEIYE